MPIAKNVVDAFTAAEVEQISGLSRPMLDYLRRMDFIRPAYGSEERRRGKVRYYSYRDLVAARLVQRLRDAGVELHKLKTALEQLQSDETWADQTEPAQSLYWLVTDGVEVFVEREGGLLERMTSDRQGVFSFVVNVGQLAAEVRLRVPEAKRADFTMENRSRELTARYRL